MKITSDLTNLTTAILILTVQMFIEWTLVLKYLNLFRKWHQGRFTNKTMDKATVNVHLTGIFLAPFVTTDSYLCLGL
jgi:hypothetical protein